MFIIKFIGVVFFSFFSALILRYLVRRLQKQEISYFNAYITVLLPFIMAIPLELMKKYLSPYVLHPAEFVLDIFYFLLIILLNLISISLRLKIPFKRSLLLTILFLTSSFIMSLIFILLFVLIRLVADPERWIPEFVQTYVR